MIECRAEPYSVEQVSVPVCSDCGERGMECAGGLLPAAGVRPYPDSRTFNEEAGYWNRDEIFPGALRLPWLPSSLEGHASSLHL